MHPALALLLALAAPNLAPSDSDWPQWRGARGDGCSHGAPWSPTGRTRWSAEIGLGYSAPVVAGARVFTLGFDEERALDVLRALDLDTGEELWRSEWPGELRDNQHEGGTLSTPAVADGRVLVATSSGAAICLSADDGGDVWSVDLAKEHGLDPGYYGFAGSPLVLDGVAYLSMDATFALDAASGELRWKSAPLEAVYSTPAAFTLGADPVLAVFGQRGLDVLARADGATRYSFPFRKGDRAVNGATPVIVGERVFVSSAYDHGCALVEVGPDGAAAVWESKAMRNKMAGCVRVGDGLFGFDESILKCLDLDGGERWRVRGLGNGALSGGDGKLAILSSAGELVVARATTGAFEELARTPVFEEGVCWTPPTIAGGLLLLRSNRGTLVCRDHRAAGEGPAATAGGPAGELPPAAEVFARHLAAVGGAEALAAHPHVHARGTYEQRSVGFVPVPFEVRRSAPDRRSVAIQLPPPLDDMFARDGVQGRLVRVCDGEEVFELNLYRGDKLYEGGEAREERAAARLPSADLAALHPEAETVARVTFDDRACLRVDARTRDGRARTLYFDAETGLLAGREAEDEALVVYAAWAEFDGLMLPTLERLYRPEGGIEETFRTESVAFEPAPEQTFMRSERVAELLEERDAGR